MSSPPARLSKAWTWFIVSWLMTNCTDPSPNRRVAPSGVEGEDFTVVRAAVGAGPRRCGHAHEPAAGGDAGAARIAAVGGDVVERIGPRPSSLRRSSGPARVAGHRRQALAAIPARSPCVFIDHEGVGRAIGDLGDAHRAVRRFGNDRGAGIDADARQRPPASPRPGRSPLRPKISPGAKLDADPEVVEAVAQLRRVIDRGIARSGRAEERRDGRRVGRVFGRHVHRIEGRLARVDLLEHAAVFHKGQNLDERRGAIGARPARRRRIGIGELPVGAREAAFVALKVEQGQADLLEIVAALRAASGLPRGVDRRQEQADEDPDDGDNDQQLNKVKPPRKRREFFIKRSFVPLSLLIDLCLVCQINIFGCKNTLTQV